MFSPPFKAPIVDLTSPTVSGARRRCGLQGGLPCVAHKIYTYHSNCGCIENDLMALKRSETCSRSHAQHSEMRSPLHIGSPLGTSRSVAMAGTKSRTGDGSALFSPGAVNVLIGADRAPYSQCADGKPVPFHNSATCVAVGIADGPTVARSLLSSPVPQQHHARGAQFAQVSYSADNMPGALAGASSFPSPTDIARLVATQHHVWAGLAGGDITILDAANGEALVTRPKAHGGPVSGIACCGALGVVTAGADGRVLLWSGDSGEASLVHQFTCPVRRLEWCEETSMLALCSDKELALYTLTAGGGAGPCEPRLLLIEPEGFSQLALTPTMLVASLGERLSVWSVEEQAVGGGKGHCGGFAIQRTPSFGSASSNNGDWPSMPKRRAAVLPQHMSGGDTDANSEAIEQFHRVDSSNWSVSADDRFARLREQNKALFRRLHSLEAENRALRSSGLAPAVVADNIATHVPESASLDRLREEVAVLRSAKESLEERLAAVTFAEIPVARSEGPSTPIKGVSRQLVGERTPTSLSPTRSSYNMKAQVDALLREVDTLTASLAAVRSEAAARDEEYVKAADDHAYKVLLLKKENEFLREELLGGAGGDGAGFSERLLSWETHSRNGGVAGGGFDDAAAALVKERAISDELDKALVHSRNTITRLELEMTTLRGDCEHYQRQLESSDVAEANALRGLVAQHERASASSRQLCDTYRKRISSLEAQLGELAAEVDNKQWSLRHKEVQTTESYASGIPRVAGTPSPPSPLKRGGQQPVSFSPLPRSSVARGASKSRLVRHDPADAKHVAECLWCSGKTFMGLGGTFGVNETHTPRGVPEHPDGSYSHSPSRAQSFSRGKDAMAPGDEEEEDWMQ